MRMPLAGLSPDQQVKCTSEAFQIVTHVAVKSISFVQEFAPHQQATVLALVKHYKPAEAKTTSFGHPEPGVPEMAAFMDTVEPCLYSVYSATTLAAIDALLCWARRSGNEYWCALLT